MAIHQAFREAEAMQHPVSFAIAQNALAALLWIGDLDVAEELADWFISRARSHAFAPYIHIGNAFKGELAIRRGDVEAGVEMLRSRLEKLHAARYELFTTRFHIILADGLAASRRFADAVALVDETAHLIDANGYTSYLPELLRLKGSILLAASDLSAAEAEASFIQSLELSCAQGSRAWEVRTATDLASLWAGQGRTAEARALLQPVFERFTEGRDTPDLKSAEAVLARLG
jgi:predicted ATPase